MPDNETIESGRFKNKFFKKEGDGYILKPLEEFEQVIILVLSTIYAIKYILMHS